MREENRTITYFEPSYAMVKTPRGEMTHRQWLKSEAKRFYRAGDPVEIVTHSDTGHIALRRVPVLPGKSSAKTKKA